MTSPLVGNLHRLIYSTLMEDKRAEPTAAGGSVSGLSVGMASGGGNRVPKETTGI